MKTVSEWDTHFSADADADPIFKIKKNSVAYLRLYAHYEAIKAYMRVMGTNFI